MDKHWLTEVDFPFDCSGFSIQPYIQPKVSKKNEHIIGVEILGRLVNSNTGEVIPPNLFIPCLRDYDLGFQYTIELIENTLLALSEANICNISIAFNVDNCLIDKHEFIDCLIQVLTSQTLIPTYLITIELTEHDLCRTQEKEEAIEVLRNHGITISLDDFGTGHATFDELTAFSYGEVKVDRSIIKDYRPNSSNSILLEQLVDFARVQKLKVVVEGIETRQILDKLKALHIDYFQGFLFYKPMSIRSFTTVYN
ncbi:EAL domain-containing protein [Vibrio aestuarianus]|uniref:EAL domain-containing protein n=1 Tax=Vibrio aestuarianus TaxID=28171 RepID=UPI00237C5326|nr:EAL domain-containing protein [Vibrio aestuarianus]MDE1352187.1 EAL domain-containing protein [Vibrio aestuarianus]